MKLHPIRRCDKVTAKVTVIIREITEKPREGHIHPRSLRMHSSPWERRGRTDSE